MLYIKKLIIENSITYDMLSEVTNKNRDYIRKCVNMQGPNFFTCDVLDMIKEFFVEKNIVSKDFDIGDFLNDV